VDGRNSAGRNRAPTCVGRAPSARRNPRNRDRVSRWRKQCGLVGNSLGPLRNSGARTEIRFAAGFCAGRRGCSSFSLRYLFGPLCRPNLARNHNKNAPLPIVAGVPPDLCRTRSDRRPEAECRHWASSHSVRVSRQLPLSSPMLSLGEEEPCRLAWRSASLEGASGSVPRPRVFFPSRSRLVVRAS